MKSPFLGFGSEEALRGLADALADGLFTTDAEGRVTFWNGAAERITGWTRAEAVGTSCSILAGDAVNGCSCGLGPIRCGLALSGRSSKQCTIRTKDGRLLVIVKSAVPLRDAEAKPVGALESFTVVRALADAAARGDGPPGLVGRHAAMQDLYRMIELVAASSATVMIVGESGTGKDQVAEAIHALSPRAARALVRVPCASIDDGLGGAGGDLDAAVEQARGGTLVVGEVADLGPAAQVRLLHLVERREASRAGRAAPADDFRLLCTTQSDLRTLVDEKRFRADLYFRLNVFPLRVPALREHLDDLPLIAERFLARLDPPCSLTPGAARALMAHRWPGNVRELQNVLEFAALRARGAPIAPEHVPELPSPPREAGADERARIEEALARCSGSRTQAARSLGISRVTLWKRMKRHGL